MMPVKRGYFVLLKRLAWVEREIKSSNPNYPDNRLSSNYIAVNFLD